MIRNYHAFSGLARSDFMIHDKKMNDSFQPFDSA